MLFTLSTINDWLTWTASIKTAPDPPSNLSIDVKSGKVAFIAWDPPATGGYSGFKLKVRYPFKISVLNEILDTHNLMHVRLSH